MKIEGVAYHSELTSDVDRFLTEIKAAFADRIKEMEDVKDEMEKIISSILHVRELSAGLDKVNADPSLAIGTTTDALGNYNDLYHNVHISISNLRKRKPEIDAKSSFLSDVWSRYEDLLHKLTMNAISSIKKCAHILGIKNFSVTISSLPPSISASFYFE